MFLIRMDRSATARSGIAGLVSCPEISHQHLVHMCSQLTHTDSDQRIVGAHEANGSHVDYDKW